MRTRVRPLLTELHAHTTWSDGVLSPRELVDLHGQAGFDVLCITDHVVRSDDPWLDVSQREGNALTAARYDLYLTEIEREAARAERAYGLLVVAGLELTYNDLDPAQAAHVVAVGLRQHVSVDDGIEDAIMAASAAGAATIAAHPFDTEPASHPARRTERFARDRRLTSLVDRVELFNRTQLFGWVAEGGLPGVAAGDVHRPEHMAGWKTLLPCAREEDAVVAYLRSARPAYLVRLDARPRALAA
jgi:predicted metal-dependent phosphoesterase TrpH